ncbi:hypothetical protein [Chryseobacterium sp. JUb7]|uniref:hypothetical protein n=1 Tax=Chryseobacterium sp. JUb7 TaxID=2940599 RepID=UPI002168CD59|nr:hypothetical protein [Chryseobacterium sp. JUb7]MCS3529902.1 hypothetical protein [Chryseobacterium sp. JUb7]
MKKLLLTFVMGFLVLSVVACKHSSKETETIITTPVDTENEITKDIFTDESGEQMEVSINHTKNTATIRLDGKTYELKKSEDLPDYTANNSEYQYSNIRGSVSFLKKDYDMVLFHSKKSHSSGSTKMASY